VKVKLNIYDVSGKMVEKILDKKLQAGTYETIWFGNEHTSGVYFCKFQTYENIHIIKLILLK
ncbi:MAG: T9SS type A sorting domain-containing protein, partial [Ignavibacteria bacterium]|nr:T9SS type A sorting domain-containing protein [Ignavibacteria bacterium]